MEPQVIEVLVGRRLFKDVDRAFNEIHRRVSEGITLSGTVVSRELRAALSKVSAELAAKHSSPWGGTVASGSSNLQMRSGGGLSSIRRSIKVRNTRSLEAVQGQISAGLLSFHETGGTIRPKSSRFLTIPLPAALNANGTPIHRRARDWDNTFVNTSRRGNLIIFQKRGQDIVPLYLLKPSVSIRPRLGMAREIDEQMGWFERRALDVIEQHIYKGFV